MTAPLRRSAEGATKGYSPKKSEPARGLLSRFYVPSPRRRHSNVNHLRDGVSRRRRRPFRPATARVRARLPRRSRSGSPAKFSRPPHFLRALSYKWSKPGFRPAERAGRSPEESPTGVPGGEATRPVAIANGVRRVVGARPYWSKVRRRGRGRSEWELSTAPRTGGLRHKWYLIAGRFRSLISAGRHGHLRRSPDPDFGDIAQ